MNALDDTVELDIVDDPDTSEWPWAVYAACRGDHDTTFFPQNRAEEAAALAVCGACPVREDCLAHAMATNERFGVWGGTTERGRRKLARAG